MPHSVSLKVILNLYNNYSTHISLHLVLPTPFKQPVAMFCVIANIGIKGASLTQEDLTFTDNI